MKAVTRLGKTQAKKLREDLSDHLLMQKAKRVKGKPITLEEYEAIRAYDAAKSSPDEVIPFEQAMREIKKSRR